MRGITVKKFQTRADYLDFTKLLKHHEIDILPIKYNNVWGPPTTLVYPRPPKGTRHINFLPEIYEQYTGQKWNLKFVLKGVKPFAYITESHQIQMCRVKSWWDKGIWVILIRPVQKKFIETCQKFNDAHNKWNTTLTPQLIQYDGHEIRDKQLWIKMFPKTECDFWIVKIRDRKNNTQKTFLAVGFGARFKVIEVIAKQFQHLNLKKGDGWKCFEFDEGYIEIF